MSVGILKACGYQITGALPSGQFITGSDVERAPLIAIDLLALGQERRGFPVIGHTLPAQAGVDGVLGLDYFQNVRLTIHFRTKSLELN